MRKLLGLLLVVGLIAALVTSSSQVILPHLTPKNPLPVPSPSPLVPPPEPKPEPKPPRKPWRPWDDCEAPVGAKVGGSVSPDGQEEIQCDLPGQFHMRNTGGWTPRGPGTGAGLCVFTSIEHSAIHQNVPELLGFQKWMAHNKPGGGYPSKVDKMIAEFCKEKGVPVPKYIQVEGNDLEILRLACKTGRPPSVTYCWSPTGRYRGKIAHMVTLPHATDGWFCVLDNNYPGENKYEWMSEDEFRKTYTGMGGGWAVILLQPGPPPAPTN